MSQVVSFQGYTPPARFDDLAWTGAEIEEASTATGAWSLIDTLTLDPVDVDPAHPQSRDLTTENASDAPDLWYRIVFVDASGDTSLPTAAVQNTLASPTSRDLCSLGDVLAYVPAYQSNEDTDAVLARLITSESETIMRASGRELVAVEESQPTARAFRIGRDAERTGRVLVGDLASVGDTDVIVELLGRDDTVVYTFARAEFHPLYDMRRQPLYSWEPVTAVEFPFGLATRRPVCGQTLLVTGNWGFPTIPPFIREACAKRVILRYVSDVAAAGTPFAAALDSLNLAALFASARDAVDLVTDKIAIR